MPAWPAVEHPHRTNAGGDPPETDEQQDDHVEQRQEQISCQTVGAGFESFSVLYRWQSAVASDDTGGYARLTPPTPTLSERREEPVLAAKSLGQEFADILEEDDLRAGKAHIAMLLDRYVAEHLPEISTVPAVRELRSQFHRHPGPIKASYPGRKYQGKASDFLEEHFADDIADGKLGPGQLALIDRPLYSALRYELSQRTPPTTIRAYFEGSLSAGARITRFQRRVSACAVLLDANEEQAARFFGGMRPDRVKPARTMASHSAT